ncbi:MAG: SUMF1/EgtB/PvdO family nonheme iron enzyme [Phycisphaerae bacterium]|nr:SUMF1/EgtB/PvdO family nonheme iron enzyme [Phycisphaerae bacterium]
MTDVTETITNEKDGSMLVLVPAGRFLAGGPGYKAGGVDEPFPVELPAYCLGMYLVTNAQYARFLSEISPKASEVKKWVSLEDDDCFVSRSEEGYVPNPGKDNHPIVLVSWYGAQAYCEWAGLRLPTELEWEKGARGTDGRKYSWGNDFDATKWPVVEDLRGPQHTHPVNCFEHGRSPYGLYQMTGNALQWCADWYEELIYERYQQGKLKPPETGKARAIRGGSWRLPDFSGPHNCMKRTGDRPKHCENDLGFRVAKDAG